MRVASGGFDRSWGLQSSFRRGRALLRCAAHRHVDRV